MNHNVLIRITVAAAAAVSLLVLAAAPVRAEGKVEPLQLRKIMQELGKDMQAVTDGISREDWAAVAQVARRIAEHPQPSEAEHARIAAFVGARAHAFHVYDEQTHHAAEALAQAAGKGNGKAVISSFARLQNNCLACHQTFRKQFVQHFYGER